MGCTKNRGVGSAGQWAGHWACSELPLGLWPPTLQPTPHCRNSRQTGLAPAASRPSLRQRQGWVALNCICFWNQAPSFSSEGSASSSRPLWVPAQGSVLVQLSLWGLSSPTRDYVKPTPPAVGAWNLNHWTAREVPGLFCLLTVPWRSDLVPPL